MSVIEDNDELADGLIAMITPTRIMYGDSSGLLAGESGIHQLFATFGVSNCCLDGCGGGLRRAVRRCRNLTSIVGHSTKLLRALGRKPAGSTPGSCPAR